MVQLSRFDRLVSSHLLEAEFRAALARQARESSIRNFLSWVTWVFPKERLTQEFDQILEIRALKGSDLWHLACALTVRPRVPNLSFLTLDRNQAEVARSLGFPGL